MTHVVAKTNKPPPLWPTGQQINKNKIRKDCLSSFRPCLHTFALFHHSARVWNFKHSPLLANMTARGPNANPVPALPGPDPTLETRPVPRERHFHVRWLGPGADPDIRQQVRSIEEIDQQLTESGFREPIDNLQKYWANWARHVLGQIISDGELDWHEDGFDFVPDPTWGLYIIVTSYSDYAQQRLEGAVLNLIETVCRYFLANTNRSYTAYGGEAFNYVHDIDRSSFAIKAICHGSLYPISPSSIITVCPSHSITTCII